MKLVVEIDEATYKDIKKGKIYSSIRDVPLESVNAIANGAPLPNGVTPKQRVGHWEIISGNNSRCSICGVYNPPDCFNRPVIYNYCPFCGAKMEGQP